MQSYQLHARLQKISQMSSNCKFHYAVFKNNMLQIMKTVEVDFQIT
jgi:hypothetical protein